MYMLVHITGTVVVMFKKRTIYIKLQRYPINLPVINNVKDIVGFLAYNLINFDNFLGHLVPEINIHNSIILSKL